MRTGRTVTKQLKIETRQHELLGFDMGEGPRRKDLLLGLFIIPTWAALIYLLIGAPTKVNLLLYILPPVLFLKYGVSESEKNPRRMNFTQWILTIRYVLVGHRPIIRVGARRASKSEYIPWAQRSNLGKLANTLGMKHLVKRNGELEWKEVSRIPGLGFTAKYSTDADTTAYKQASGKLIEISPTTYLIGTDYLVGVGQRVQQKKIRKSKK